MTAVSGTPIVERALELAALHPAMAAVHVLDAAMQGHHGQTIDFRRTTPGGADSDWLDPPSAFAELLRRAFGAHLAPENVDCASPAWEFDVIDAFAERYDVIPAGSGDADRATITHDGPRLSSVVAGATPRSGSSYSPLGAAF